VELFEHQRMMLKHHLSQLNTLDASDLGCGKTCPAILCLQKLFDQGKISKVLVVCPNTILDNWINEIQQWSKLTYSVLRGKKDKRLAALEEDKQIYLINFEGIRVVYQELSKYRFDGIVIDEVHHIKSQNAQVTKLLLTLSPKVKFRKGLTGTLITNQLDDVWSIAEFIDPKIFKRNYWGFKNKTMFNANANKPWMSWPDWQPRPGAANWVREKLSAVTIRFEKKDVLKFLPPVLFEKRYIELSTEQAKFYKDLKRHFVAELDNDYCDRCEHSAVKHWGTENYTACQFCDCPEFTPRQFAALQILERVNKLQQICSGFVYRKNEPTYLFKQNAKLDELHSVLEEIGDKRVCIWTAFREDVEIIRHGGGTRSLAIKSEVITGDTKAEDRQPIVDAFNRGDFQYLIANPSCAGEGLNVFCPYAIYFSRSYKLGERIQSLGRHHRPGAEIFENITIIDLVAKDTVEESVLEALETKKNLLESINPRSAKEWFK